MRSMALDPRKRQLMFIGAISVALLNSVVAGVFGGLVASATLSVSIEASAAAGAVTGLLVAMVFIRHEVVQWRRAEATLRPLFPSPDSHESKELV
jgi:membrane associated rhomboid family serine protease